MLLEVFPCKTTFRKMRSKPDMTVHGRSTINTLYNAKRLTSKIAKQLNRSGAEIRRYIKDS